MYTHRASDKDQENHGLHGVGVGSAASDTNESLATIPSLFLY